MTKSQTTSHVAVMEAGVRTRAKTLALQKLQSPATSYLQLRSRKLEKLLSPHSPRTGRNPSPKKSPKSKLGMMNSKDGVRIGPEFGEEGEDWSVEASFGENELEFDGQGRSTRESTPCSFIREPVTAETPSSTTRQASLTITNRRTQNSNPTSQEIEEFLASMEKQRQTLFAEKYNFDVANEVPLPGRYEWVKLEN